MPSNPGEWLRTSLRSFASQHYLKYERAVSFQSLSILLSDYAHGQNMRSRNFFEWLLTIVHVVFTVVERMHLFLRSLWRYDNGWFCFIDSVKMSSQRPGHRTRSFPKKIFSGILKVLKRLAGALQWYCGYMPILITTKICWVIHSWLFGVRFQLGLMNHFRCFGQSFFHRTQSERSHDTRHCNTLYGI